MKKLIITETDKDYIKSLYGLLNEQNSKPPIEIKLKSENANSSGPTFRQGFNMLDFYCTNNVSLSFKIGGEKYEFSEDFNITILNDEGLFMVKDINSTISSVIVSLKYFSSKKLYRLIIKRDINFKLEIRQKNSENKTPFILPIQNKIAYKGYDVSLVGVKNIEYKYRKLKPNEQPQIDFPFDKESFLVIPEEQVRSNKLNFNKKTLVIIESPIEIQNIDLVNQKSSEGKDFIRKDNRVFISWFPINNNNLTLITPNQRIIINYNEILPNETNYFVLEPIKK